ncbi:hypothetical protein B0H10DRAFT_1787591, partial [Mycena sp. CBHHK59/15]
IPDSPLSVRIFPGGVETYALYLLDFFDPIKDTAVNSPTDFQIHPIPPTGTFGLPGPLVSMEVAMKIEQKDILPGEERFGVAESSVCRLVRPGKPDFYFSIPVRPMAGVPPCAGPTPYSPRH